MDPCPDQDAQRGEAPQKMAPDPDRDTPQRAPNARHDPWAIILRENVGIKMLGEIDQQLQCGGVDALLQQGQRRSTAG